MKNFLIGYGETLTNPVYIKTGGGDKKHPYSVEEGRQRFQHNLEEIMWEIEHKPTDACANDEVEPYRVCRRVNILRDYPDDKIKIYP